MNYRNSTAYKTLNQFTKDAQQTKEALFGTHLNTGKTYRIDDINFKEFPFTGIYIAKNK